MLDIIANVDDIATPGLQSALSAEDHIQFQEISWFH